MRWGGTWCLAALLLIGCSARPSKEAYLDGRQVNLAKLTAGDVARAVRIIPREQDVLFQAPTLETTKLIDLRSAGKEMGINLGDVERMRMGSLSGMLDRRTGALQHYLLFQSNFVIGTDRYAAVNLPSGEPLPFSVSRVPDPCVPSCFPVTEALIVSVPDPVLRAQAAAGLPLTITLKTGDVIELKGLPVYVEGYLLAIDDYRGRAAGN